MQMNQGATSNTEKEHASIIDTINKQFNILADIYSKRLLDDTSFSILQIGHLHDLVLNLSQRILHNKNEFNDILTKHTYNYIDALNSVLQHCINIQDPSKNKDKRFKHDLWYNNPFYNFLRESYLGQTKIIDEFLKCLEELFYHKPSQLVLYLRAYIDAISPSNFLYTNPEIIETTIQQNGTNLLVGWSNFLQDLIDNKGHLNIALTSKKEFILGVNVAATKGDVVYQNEYIQLIHYAPVTEQVYSTPLIIIPPFINKFYILDLNPEKSLVNYLVHAGFNVFMISWVNPTPEYRDKTFFDYMQYGPISAINIVSSICASKVNALGYCVGGTLLACCASYLKRQNIKTLNSISYLTTMVDFSSPGELGIFIDEQQLSALDQLMQERGVLESHYLQSAFNLLRPNDLIWPYFINNYLHGKQPEAFDLLCWNSDGTNQPATMYSFYLNNFYLHNKFAKTKLVVNDTLLSLKDITVPIFAVSCIYDHITPWQSNYHGLTLQPGSKTFVLSGSGHIAGIVNPPSQIKYGYWTNKEFVASPEEWLKTATKHEGSWWPYWSEWLTTHSGKKIPSSSLPIFNKLEPAPGSYVKVKR